MVIISVKNGMEPLIRMPRFSDIDGFVDFAG
jgi:hypothetical protein